jgi:hypothetical protein
MASKEEATCKKNQNLLFNGAKINSKIRKIDCPKEIIPEIDK